MKGMDNKFDERKARGATTGDEAQEAIIEFIREGQGAQSRHNVANKSQGFDLYLPWLIEVIEYVEPYDEKEALPILQLHRLYMDSAWKMVMMGILRPGPKSLSSGSESNTYGRAFSLIEGVAL
jgi:hypothetical protein